MIDLADIENADFTALAAAFGELRVDDTRDELSALQLETMNEYHERCASIADFAAEHIRDLISVQERRTRWYRTYLAARASVAYTVSV